MKKNWIFWKNWNLECNQLHEKPIRKKSWKIEKIDFLLDIVVDDLQPKRISKSSLNKGRSWFNINGMIKHGCHHWSSHIMSKKSWSWRESFFKYQQSAESKKLKIAQEWRHNILAPNPFKTDSSYYLQNIPLEEARWSTSRLWKAALQILVRFFIDNWLTGKMQYRFFRKSRKLKNHFNSWMVTLNHQNQIPWKRYINFKINSPFIKRVAFWKLVGLAT